MEPSYPLTDFKTACKRDHANVVILRGAKETARTDFKLNTKQDILAFINNGGLEEMKFIHTKPWENNHDSQNHIMVDSYGFYSGKLYGYIAFMFVKNTKKWTIKSFKKNNDLDIRNLPFNDLKDLIH